METSPSSSNPLVILNPAANRGNMMHHRTVVRSRAELENAEYIETTKQGEAKELARCAAEQDRPIVIVGGDGTVHEVINGILAAGRRVPLGIVAAGSGNDYAWNTLKLPHDPAAAIERAFTGQLIDADAGIVNGEYFVNSFSVGLDADIAVAAGQMKKIPYMSGARLYYGTTLKQLLFGYHRCPWLTLRLDDGQQLDETQAKRYVLMAVTNGPTYGAGFRINPTADHTDGLFDICTISYTPSVAGATALAGGAERRTRWTARSDLFPRKIGAYRSATESEYPDGRRNNVRNQLRRQDFTGSTVGAGVKFDDMLYSMLRSVAWLFTHLICRYQVSGREHVPISGPLLVVANHLSWYDPILLALVLPRRVWFFAKVEVFRWPIVGWLCRLTGQIPVHRGEGDRAALEKALAYLREGKALMVFPEGTVERQEQMITPHTGVAMLALRSGATMLPIAHTGTRRVLRSLRVWFPPVNIQIGDPYIPALPEGIARKAILQKVTQNVMERIAAMLPPERRGVYE